MSRFRAAYDIGHNYTVFVGEGNTLAEAVASVAAKNSMATDIGKDVKWRLNSSSGWKFEELMTEPQWKEIGK